MFSFSNWRYVIENMVARDDRDLSPTLDDKNGLVVDTIRFTILR